MTSTLEKVMGFFNSKHFKFKQNSKKIPVIQKNFLKKKIKPKFWLWLKNYSQGCLLGIIIRAQKFSSLGVQFY